MLRSDAAPLGRPITWTRLAIISLDDEVARHTGDGRETAQEPERHRQRRQALLREAAGNQTSYELRRHILIAADVVAAAQAGDAAKLADAQARWAENADVIAAVLASANPRFWKLAAMKAELRTHLRLTAEEAVARCGPTGRRTSRRTTRSTATPCTCPTACERTDQAVPEAVPLAAS